MIVSAFDAGSAGRPAVERSIADEQGGLSLRLSPSLTVWACAADLRDIDLYEPLKGPMRAALWPAVRPLLEFRPRGDDRGLAARPAILGESIAGGYCHCGFGFDLSGDLPPNTPTAVTDWPERYGSTSTVAERSTSPGTWRRSPGLVGPIARLARSSWSFPTRLPPRPGPGASPCQSSPVAAGLPLDHHFGHGHGRTSRPLVEASGRRCAGFISRYAAKQGSSRCFQASEGRTPSISCEDSPGMRASAAMIAISRNSDTD